MTRGPSSWQACLFALNAQSPADPSVVDQQDDFDDRLWKAPLDSGAIRDLHFTPEIHQRLQQETSNMYRLRNRNRIGPKRLNSGAPGKYLLTIRDEH